MKASDILNSKRSGISAITPDWGLKAAADRLRLENIGALLVTEGGHNRGHLLGLISEREIVRAFSCNGDSFSTLPVRDWMTSATSCALDDDLRRIASRMTSERIRYFVVLDENRIAGVISIGDVIKSRMQDLELETNVLRAAYMAVR